MIAYFSFSVRLMHFTIILKIMYAVLELKKVMDENKSPHSCDMIIVSILVCLADALKWHVSSMGPNLTLFSR